MIEMISADLIEATERITTFRLDPPCTSHLFEERFMGGCTVSPLMVRSWYPTRCGQSMAELCARQYRCMVQAEIG